MLVEWLLDLFQAVVVWMGGLLPNDSTNFFRDINQIASNLGALNYFLPIAETVAIVVAVFALFPIFLGVTLALWVAAQLRGSSSVG